MTHPAEEKLAAIVAGLDGVPEGPWEWGTGLSENYMMDARGEIILDDGSSSGEYGQTLDPKSPLGVHLPRCYPATMREIAARMAELKAENTRLTFERNLVSQAIEDTVAELGCPPDNEEILFAISALRTRAETAERELAELIAQLRDQVAIGDRIERERDAALAECEHRGQALTDCITVFGVTQDTQLHQAYADVIARAALTKKGKAMKISDEMIEKAMDGIVCRELDNDQMRKALEAVAPMIRAEEREACARLVEQRHSGADGMIGDYMNVAYQSAAAAIRARKEAP